jgi:hypothetical protein
LPITARVIDQVARIHCSIIRPRRDDFNPPSPLARGQRMG